jgi:nicotinic acid mononucleotide adenylyltransferase
MMNGSIKQYLKSESTRLGMLAGAVFYLSYAVTQGAYLNFVLLSVSLFIAFAIPVYSRFSNTIEEKVAFKTALVTPGRFARFSCQFVFNFTVFYLLTKGGLLNPEKIAGLGGFAGIAALTTLLSQGAQYIALSFSNREFGNKNFNVLLALSINIFITALSAAGLPLLQKSFLLLSAFLGGALFLLGAMSDYRSIFFPKSGVGVFFGTFNPFHVTHIELIKRAIKERGLSKVYVHSTVVPKLHRDALNAGAIKIARREMSMRVYEKTPNADVHVNYFPTGNRFFEFETRCIMAELALKEAGLADKVTILKWPRLYERKGFYGVLARLKKKHPASALHGIHGSDVGGMWVRNIYDECGWIYPYAVKRKNKVSATAIRNGARGMLTPTLENILDNLRNGIENFCINGMSFRSENGVLSHES